MRYRQGCGPKGHIEINLPEGLMAMRGGRGWQGSWGPFHFDFGDEGWSGGRRGRRARRMFESGELRLVLLKLIVDEPRHGYDLIRAIEEARSHGDLSENAEYHAAKEQQGWVEARVAELEDKISRAEVIDISRLSGDTVKFGAKVTLVDEDTEDESIYQIVGEFEADVKKGLISVSSPIARAIIGKRTGDSVEVSTPGGGKSYEIVKVRYN